MMNFDATRYVYFVPTAGKLHKPPKPAYIKAPEKREAEFPHSVLGKIKFEDEFDDPDLKIVHVVGNKNKGGVTFAYMKDTPFNNCRMVEVAVAYCSEEDYFNRKIGRQNAIANFKAGMTVLVPARTSNDDYSIPENLRNMFWHSLALGN